MHRSKIPVKDFGQPSWSKVVFKDLHADGCLMSNHGPRPSYADVVEAMLRPEAYLSEPAVSQSTDRLEKIGHHETHISDVFLAGRLVYKLKKPVKTNFLDYSTLELRKYFCEQEFRLDRRYAQDLYLEVVPITYDGELIRIAGEGETVEYAVKMRRFDSDALLASRVDQGEVTASDIRVI